MNDEEAEYALALPFVVCQSQGGPYEDEAFTAGFAAGLLWEQLSWGQICGDSDEVRSFRSDLMPLVDLIAMRYGATVQVEGADDEWTRARIVMA